MDNENTNDINTEESETSIEVNEAARKYKMEATRYTYSDYASWDDHSRFELIDGIAYAMSAPTATHQRIIGKLFVQLFNFLNDKPCEVFISPFDVCLSGKGRRDDTVVQPDILVVCDESKIIDEYCNGAPDLIIEILSPSSQNHDRLRKLNKYMTAGAREYWIVDPEINDVTVHILERGKYVLTAYKKTDVISVQVLEGCNIDLSKVF